ncbi:alpha/beta hydrolase [Acrocarpospora sp. B8E8]|uniref:alpha/beta fold hydrolase n=1 Tax=Acrocarpospora sp. B8E8 TaxID=3153572 RepID=UPI00325D856E
MPRTVTADQTADDVTGQRSPVPGGVRPDRRVRHRPRVTCPTLILHSRDDERVPASQANELAALIPDSRLVLLDSRNHLLTSSEPAWVEFLTRIDAFLTE